jgi:hypothetical protein
MEEEEEEEEEEHSSVFGRTVGTARVAFKIS